VGAHRGRAAGRARPDPRAENVRALDDAHVQALAGSIRLQGCSFRSSWATTARRSSSSPAFHRIAAALPLGLAEAPVVVRDVDLPRREPPACESGPDVGPYGLRTRRHAGCACRDEAAVIVIVGVVEAI
jgi:hypothetical protein